MNQSPAVDATALARDVIVFDQKGCLSPRVAVVVGSEVEASSFAEALDDALAQLDVDVPRGPLDADAAAAVTLHVSTARALGGVVEKSYRADGSREIRDHVVTLERAPSELVLPPPERVIHVVSFAEPEAATRWIEPFSRFITTIGLSDNYDRDLVRDLEPLCPGARVTTLGAMQRPPLDGPVDRRPHARR
jgi:hypothetical protein